MDGKTLAIVSIVGMGLNLVGLVMLFFFAMPYRVRSGGEVGIAWDGKDEAAVWWERLYGILGWIGLAIAIIGTAMQAWSTAVQGKLL